MSNGLADTKPATLLFWSFTVLIFSYYLCSLMPAVPPRDSGELITAVHVLGIAHAPAFPLYVLAGKCFTSLVQIGNIAFRVNLFSALTSALSIGLMFVLLRSLTGSITPGILAGIILATSHPFWSSALTAEVFSLNCAFVLAIFLSLLHAYKFKSPRHLILACFLFGVGLSNQPILLFIFPSILLVALKLYGQASFKKTSALACTAFLLGLTLYSYILVRGTREPLLSVGDPTTLKGFIGIVARSEYGTFKLVKKGEENESLPSSIPERLSFFADGVWDYLGPWIFLGLVGAVSLSRREKFILTIFISAFITTGPLFFLMTNVSKDPSSQAILERFFTVPLIFLCVFLGLGFHHIESIVDRAIHSQTVRAILLLSLITVHYRYASIESKRHDFLAWDFANNLLGTAKHDSLVFTTLDTGGFAPWATQVIWNKRHDVEFRGLGYWNGKHVPGYLEKARFEYPNVYVMHPAERNKYLSSYIFIPQGLLYEAHRPNRDTSNLNSLGYAHLSYFYIYRKVHVSETHHFFKNEILDQYSYSFAGMGDFLSRRSMSDPARKCYQQMVLFSSDKLHTYSRYRQMVNDI